MHWHQAALHNPNVSDEAKQNSRKVVEDIQGPDTVHMTTESEPSSRRDVDDSGKDENRVLGGYKATLKSASSFLNVCMTGLIHLSSLCYRSQRQR
jgi:Conidiation protein 6